MWSRIDLKNHAKSILKLRYWPAVLVSLVLGVITSSSGTTSANQGRRTWADNSYHYSAMDINRLAMMLGLVVTAVLFIAVIAFAFQCFAWNPLEVGCKRFFTLSLSQPAKIGEMGFAFSHSYMNIVKTQFFRSLFTFAWSLLLIVPGIIKAYEYLMVPYILAENPDMDAREVFALSKAMMDGDKWNAFVLHLSFIGWFLLSALTCGILSIFYVSPYYNLTDAELYAVLKQKVAYHYSGSN